MKLASQGGLDDFEKLRCVTGIFKNRMKVNIVSHDSPTILRAVKNNPNF
jgi:hypothetical protein